MKSSGAQRLVGRLHFDSNSDDPKRVLSSHAQEARLRAGQPGPVAHLHHRGAGRWRNLANTGLYRRQVHPAKVDLINRWIAEGRMRAVNPHATAHAESFRGMTQHYADYGVQVHIMLGLAPDEPIDREPTCVNSPALCCWAAASHQTKAPPHSGILGCPRGESRQFAPARGVKSPFRPR